jgi:hypothetical protein
MFDIFGGVGTGKTKKALLFTEADSLVLDASLKGSTGG